MDILKFVNSRDIREHLRKIGYQFSTIEAAWMIWQSKDTSLWEKHEAWKEIIETMSDCEIEGRSQTDYRPSLHHFLLELMELQKRQIQILQAVEEEVVYSYSILPVEGDEWLDESDDFAFTYTRCMEKAFAECKRYQEQWKPEMNQRQYLASCRILIYKRWIDSKKHPIMVEFNGYGESLNIEKYTNLSLQDKMNLYYGFGGMWFAFPTPFKKGDILKGRGWHEEPFVLDSLDADGEYKERLLRKGDSTDMIARGFFQDSENGKIYYECMHDYMSLEYYRGELMGIRRVLKALSNYLKDEIDIDLYSNAYRTIIEQEHTKALFPRRITDEGLVLAGLIE